MVSLKNRKTSINKTSRKSLKRNQLGGATDLHCVYINVDQKYYPVLLTANVSIKDNYIHHLKTTYVDNENDMGDFFANSTRQAKITRNTENTTVSSVIRDVNWDDYNEEIAVEEQEEKFYQAFQDFDGLIYEVNDWKSSTGYGGQPSKCSEILGCCKDGEETSNMASVITRVEYFITNGRHQPRRWR